MKDDELNRIVYYCFIPVFLKDLLYSILEYFTWICVLVLVVVNLLMALQETSLNQKLINPKERISKTTTNVFLRLSASCEAVQCLYEMGRAREVST